MTTVPAPKPGFFADEMTERVFTSLVALAAEVSVLRERVAQLEKAQGMATPEPGPAAECFVAEIFGHLAQPLPQM
ncbi:MAG: hypothetical protein QM682_09095 [Paracoccus sp. (in: a-proteobacteria)]|uniref:hypothetical protein n=1 Tax=Paracoccus sp. TaxID=267 RepID=UPI0039E5DF3A